MLSVSEENALRNLVLAETWCESYESRNPTWLVDDEREEMDEGKHRNADEGLFGKAVQLYYLPPAVTKTIHCR